LVGQSGGVTAASSAIRWAVWRAELTDLHLAVKTAVQWADDSDALKADWRAHPSVGQSGGVMAASSGIR
jgi:hypothetical protein